MIDSNGIKINQKGLITDLKETNEGIAAGIISMIQVIDDTYLLNNKYILVQKGKKNYYLVIAE